jgi:hypothetical protein
MEKGQSEASQRSSLSAARWEFGMGRERLKHSADSKVQGRSAGYQFRRDSFGQNTLTNSPAMAPCAADVGMAKTF